MLWTQAKQRFSCKIFTWVTSITKCCFIHHKMLKRNHTIEYIESCQIWENNSWWCMRHILCDTWHMQIYRGTIRANKRGPITRVYKNTNRSRCHSVQTENLINKHDQNYSSFCFVGLFHGDGYKMNIFQLSSSGPGPEHWPWHHSYYWSQYILKYWKRTRADVIIQNTPTHQTHWNFSKFIHGSLKRTRADAII